jgi:hypothetical protein
MRIRAHFAKKAEHNKRESLGLFVLVITATLSVSGFVAFGNDTITGKVVPLCLSLIATATSTWLQFRKPHQLWAIYRSAQRYVENALVKYRFGIDEYESASDKNKLLAKNVAQIALAAHELWVPLVPSPEQLDRLRATPQLIDGTASRAVAMLASALSFRTTSLINASDLQNAKRTSFRPSSRFSYR